MSDFINTRTEMGETAAFDALVGNTLTELNEDALVALTSRGLCYKSRLRSVNFPNLQNTRQYTMEHCTNLKVVDIGGICTIGNRCFDYCPNLSALIMRGNGVGTLQSTSAFPDNLFKLGMCRIYVPSGLVADYKTATNWSTFADFIYPIDDYQITEFGTITDSWEDIFEAESDGTYKTKYSIGDTKTMYIGTDKVNMQIVAFDTDRLADGSGKAKITWICENIYTTSTQPYSVPAASFPSEVQQNLKSVLKYTRLYNKSELSQVLTAWLPSAQEVNCNSANSVSPESSGVTYDEFFTDAASRIKYSILSSNSDLRSYWWLRTHASNFSTYYAYITSAGTVSNNYYNGNYGIAFGFCT